MKLSFRRLPKIWPIYNLLNIVFNDTKAEHDNNKSLFREALNRELMVIFYVLFSLIIYRCTYPLANPITTMHGLLQYCLTVILRDLLIVFVFYGTFHWLLYGNNRFARGMKSKKFNKRYPKQKQWKRDRFWSLFGCAVSSFYEIAIFILFDRWFYDSFWMYPMHSLFWLWCIGFIRGTHFYFSHRTIHPWKWRIGGVDVGMYLYKNVHYKHHLSVNVGVWSGLLMHPIEHFIYFSSLLFPLILGVKQHFFHVITHKFSSLLTPIISHDGFDDPGAGSYFHYLHHKHFDCNYGTTSFLCNFDKLFGTYEDGKM
eukprot:227943_1